LIIEKEENLDNQDELELQTSCSILVRGTYVEIHRNAAKYFGKNK